MCCNVSSYHQPWTGLFFFFWNAAKKGGGGWIQSMWSGFFPSTALAQLSLLSRAFCSVHFLVSACSAQRTGRLPLLPSASEQNRRVGHRNDSGQWIAVLKLWEAASRCGLSYKLICIKWVSGHGSWGKEGRSRAAKVFTCSDSGLFSQLRSIVKT